MRKLASLVVNEDNPKPAESTLFHELELDALTATTGPARTAAATSNRVVASTHLEASCQGCSRYLLEPSSVCGGGGGGGGTAARISRPLDRYASCLLHRPWTVSREYGDDDAGPVSRLRLRDLSLARGICLLARQIIIISVGPKSLVSPV